MQTASDTPPGDTTALSFYIGAVFCADSEAEQDGDKNITPAARLSSIDARLSDYFQPSAGGGGGGSVEDDNNNGTMLFHETIDENALLPDPANKASTFSSAHCLASHSEWGAGGVKRCSARDGRRAQQ